VEPAAGRVGLGQRLDLLAAAGGLAKGRGLAEAPSALAGLAGGRRPDRLVAGQFGLGECARKKGGDQTGPNPTDRGKPGSKRHLVVDRRGIPLVIRLSAANTHDSRLFAASVDGIPPILGPRGRPGRPRKRPLKLHADKAYDTPRCRRHLHRHGIRCRIARKGIESSQKLGRHRWVVERTLAWFARYRRLTIRYERRDDVHLAFLHLASALVCLHFLPPGAGF
jgi:transposase